MTHGDPMQAQNNQNNTQNDSFSNRLKLRRAEMGMNQDELADRAGISKTILSRYERGVAEPKPSTLLSLAAALNCTASWLDQGMVKASTEHFEMVRIPVPRDLMARIVDSTKESGREPVTEILFRLEESFSASDQMSDDDKRLLAHLKYMLDAFKSTSDDFEAELKDRTYRYFKEHYTLMEEAGKLSGLDENTELFGYPGFADMAAHSGSVITTGKLLGKGSVKTREDDSREE